MKRVEEVIAEILVELDKCQSEYQRHYYRYYGEVDKTSKHIHQGKVEVCETILKKLRRK